MNTFNSAEWTFGKKIGSGSFGNVYICTKEDSRLDTCICCSPKTDIIPFTPKSIAVKKFVEPDFNDPIIREIACLRLLQFQDADYKDFLIGIQIEKDKINMALELADGTLEDYAATLNQTERIDKCPHILDLLIKNLYHIHSLDIIHADVKAKNILVWWKNNKPLRCLIVDFSLSSSLPDKGDCVYTQLHGAPEMDYGAVASKESDIWVLGMSIITFLTKTAWERYVVPWYIVEATKCSETIKNMMSKNRSIRLTVYETFTKISTFLPEREWKISPLATKGLSETKDWCQTMAVVVKKLKWKKEALLIATDIFARVGILDAAHMYIALSFAGDWTRDYTQDELDEDLIDFDLKRKVFIELNGFIYIPGFEKVHTIDDLNLESFDEMVKSSKKLSKCKYNITKTPTHDWMKTEEDKRKEALEKQREEEAIEEKREARDEAQKNKLMREHKEGVELLKRQIPEGYDKTPVDELTFYCLTNDLEKVRSCLPQKDPTDLNCIAIETAMCRKNYAIMKELLSHEKVDVPLANKWVKQLANEIGDKKAIKLLAGCKSTLISKKNFATQTLLF